MAINLDVALLNLLGIIAGSIIVSPILWLVGKAFVGKEKAKLRDAFWIVFLGLVISGLFNTVFFAVFVGYSVVAISFIIQLLIWLGLVKHFFDTETWGKAFAIAIVAVVVTAIILAILITLFISLKMLTGWLTF